MRIRAAECLGLEVPMSTHRWLELHLSRSPAMTADRWARHAAVVQRVRATLPDVGESNRSGREFAAADAPPVMR